MSGGKARRKTQIYFSRAYRHFESNIKERLLFLFVCVLPCLVVLLFFYTRISYALAVWVKQELLVVIPESSSGIAYGEFLPIFGGVYFVQIPSKTPSFQELTINLVLTFLLLSICFFSSENRKGGTPLFIYLAIILLTHLVACIFFMFAKDFFPYSATQYSELYIKQQVSIWLSFLVLSGLIMGILGYAGIAGKLTAFWGIMAYSFVFGCIRYLVFMFIVSAVSSLYMAILFFALGPLFDFIYLVYFYAIYINLQIKRFDQGEGRLKWHWL